MTLSFKKLAAKYQTDKHEKTQIAGHTL